MRSIFELCFDMVPQFSLNASPDAGDHQVVFQRWAFAQTELSGLLPFLTTRCTSLGAPKDKLRHSIPMRLAGLRRLPAPQVRPFFSSVPDDFSFSSSMPKGNLKIFLIYDKARKAKVSDKGHFLYIYHNSAWEYIHNRQQKPGVIEKSPC